MNKTLTWPHLFVFSPLIVHQLLTNSRPGDLQATPTYGDVISSPGCSRKRKSVNKYREEGSSHGGDAKRHVRGENSNKHSQLYDDCNTSSSESDSESISESEKESEPKLDKSRKAPKLQLRPEKIDNVYVPEDKRDMRRFDFDAEKLDVPVYEFECPVPEPFTRINFKYHARENTDWRSQQLSLDPDPIDDTLSAIFDRLADLSRKEVDTEDWEDRRLTSARKRHHKSSGSRPASSGCSRDKRCCNNCLQPACVGDCPLKRHPSNVCDKCHQALCTGKCTETKYEQHMRQPREPSSSVPPKIRRPKSCRSCQKKHNAAFINANNVVLGRPSSAFSTFTRGKHSTKPKLDLRPVSISTTPEYITKGIEKLGLNATKPTTTPQTFAARRRARCRGDMLVGKTCFSNLSRSLTELSVKKKRGSK